MWEQKRRESRPVFWVEGKTCDVPKEGSTRAQGKEVKEQEGGGGGEKIVAGVRNEHRDYGIIGTEATGKAGQLIKSLGDHNKDWLLAKEPWKVTERFRHGSEITKFVFLYLDKVHFVTIYIYIYI